MYIAIEKDRSSLDLAIFLVVSLAVMASVYGLIALKVQIAWLLLLLSGIALVVFVVVSLRDKPVAVIDESGVYDARLGVGLIHWSEIEDVQIEVSYGNRFLCFRVRNPEQYLSRLNGSQREKHVFKHQLGFQRFNVDVRGLDCSLLDLKEQIEIRIAQHR